MITLCQMASSVSYMFIMTSAIMRKFYVNSDRCHGEVIYMIMTGVMPWGSYVFIMTGLITGKLYT